MLLDSARERIFGLDVMRAGAIVLVVFGHCLVLYPNANGYVTSILQVFAFLGVEIFFVLSGFLIGGILYRLYVTDNFNTRTVLHFMRRRWFRTLPNYFLALLLNILIAYSYVQSQSEIWTYWLFLQNFSSAMPLFFPESWSLSIEEFSYLLLPFFLLLASLLFKPRNRSHFFAIIVAFLIFTFLITKVAYHFATGNSDIQRWNSSLKSVVIYRLDSIFIGVFCSWIAIKFNAFWKKYKNYWGILGVLMLGFMFVGMGYFQILISTHSFFWNVGYLPLLSAVIALFLPLLSEWRCSDSVFIRPITFISAISYSIYLLHYSIILQLLQRYFPNLVGTHLLTAVYLAITIAASYLTYRFYEQPLMKIRNERF